MEITMGKVLVTARIENLEDLFRLSQGDISADEVRTVEVDDALVDTGATLLSLPTKLVNQLGLPRIRKRRVRTTAGYREANACGAVKLTIQGRDCTLDVVEVHNDCPVLIGQIPLEALDFVVDSIGQKLIGNPEHNGEHVVELL